MLPIKFEQIELDVDISNAKEAIQYAGNLLVKSNSVKESYVDAMIKGFEDLGPYIVLAPNIAIPHARPEFGVNEQCVAFIRLKKAIPFGHPENDDVKLIIPIGGVNMDLHIHMLRDLSEVLANEKHFEILMKSQNKEEIYNLLKGDL